MAMIRRNPNRGLSLVRPYNVLDELERIMTDFWPTDYYETWTSGFLPMDMWEDKDELFLRVEVPGVTKEDIDISLDGNRLTIKAEKKQEKQSEDTTCYMEERVYGKWVRTVSLPFPVRSDKITTRFEDGILEITLPKAEEAKAKHIAIKGSTPKALPSKTK